MFGVGCNVWQTLGSSGATSGVGGSYFLFGYIRATCYPAQNSGFLVRLVILIYVRNLILTQILASKYQSFTEKITGEIENREFQAIQTTHENVLWAHSACSQEIELSTAHISTKSNQRGSKPVKRKHCRAPSTAYTKYNRDLPTRVAATDSFASNLSFSLHHQKSAQKTFAILQMVRRTFSRITRMVFQILHEAYVRPLLEYANQVFYSGRTKYFTIIGRVQRAATKMFAGLKSVDYETPLAVLDLFPRTLFEQSLANRLFTVDPANTRRGHGKEILKLRAHTFIRQNFLISGNSCNEVQSATRHLFIRILALASILPRTENMKSSATPVFHLSFITAAERQGPNQPRNLGQKPRSCVSIRESVKPENSGLWPVNNVLGNVAAVRLSGIVALGGYKHEMSCVDWYH
ncbi:LOW QUALITY PROTEIN: hypothetical protein T265_14180 [Opisthorchis viverrini]|uniref:Uncharacterized protein n=1 Tax=Opisthorchis viverrini TaxID=6198 RepID=A0A074ZEK8_OPIVI|nr:LOW QUALITY PROTEIN: hypothetical protein T265_14180 [Opisthorchis viverrini]KER25613.1 LOW QUALITY PROTEIN: hypothetical protein T265_14180 [Opisthorchis viverrini]